MELNIKGNWSDEFLRRMSNDEFPLDDQDKRYLKPVVCEEMGYVLWKTIFNSFEPYDSKLEYNYVCYLPIYRLSSCTETLNKIDEAREVLKSSIGWSLDTIVFYGNYRTNIIQVRWGTLLKYLFNFASDTDDFSYVVCPYSTKTLLFSGNRRGISTFERKEI